METVNDTVNELSERNKLVSTLAKKYYNPNFLKINPENHNVEDGKSEAIYEFNSPIKLTSFDIATYSRDGVYFALYYYDEDLVGKQDNLKKQVLLKIQINMMVG